jgi:hypothetical protein
MGVGAGLYHTSQNASLPLCVSSRCISWMAPKGAEDGLRTPATREMAVEELPLGPYGGLDR